MLPRNLCSAGNIPTRAGLGGERIKAGLEHYSDTPGFLAHAVSGAIPIADVLQ